MELHILGEEIKSSDNFTQKFLLKSIKINIYHFPEFDVYNLKVKSTLKLNNKRSSKMIEWVTKHILWGYLRYVRGIFRAFSVNISFCTNLLYFAHCAAAVVYFDQRKGAEHLVCWPISVLNAGLTEGSKTDHNKKEYFILYLAIMKKQ